MPQMHAIYIERGNQIIVNLIQITIQRNGLWLNFRLPNNYTTAVRQLPRPHYMPVLQHHRNTASHLSPQNTNWPIPVKPNSSIAFVLPLPHNNYYIRYINVVECPLSSSAPLLWWWWGKLIRILCLLQLLIVVWGSLASTGNEEQSGRGGPK